MIGQTANILLYLGAAARLAPRGEAERLWAHQMQLTLADLLVEVHDTHHPIAGGLYYEDQKKAAKRRADDFLAHPPAEVPRLFREGAGAQPARGGQLAGRRRLTYADLSMFQVVEGLRYAFPRASAPGVPYPRVIALHDRVAARPRVAAYLGSERRIPFNEWGIFRHYPELDR